MAKKEKYVISTCYNEYETAKGILLLEMERRKTFLRHISNKTIQYYYILITKYLVSLKSYSSDFIKTIIRRHIAITAYMYWKDKKEDKYRIYQFDNLLNKEKLEFDDLKKEINISSNEYNPFVNIYKGSDYVDIKDGINTILVEKNELGSLLLSIFDYFYYGCGFADLNYINHNDLLISYSIHNYEFDNFKFKPLDEDYASNWVSTESFKQMDVKEKILGLIINIIMKSGNLSFKNEIKLTHPKYYYEMMINILYKEILKNKYAFFDVSFNNEPEANILPIKIKKPFKFKYNDINYEFTKDGIKEIKIND